MFQPLPESPAQAGTAPGRLRLLMLLGPALAIILLFFGGGIFLGILQALGYRPGAGGGSLSLSHFAAVFTDPDFSTSLLMTLYIATVSTLAAALCSLPLALLLTRLAATSSWINVILQIPLTVPHLVIGICISLLLSPAGLVSRLLSWSGLIAGPAAFPLLVNDTWSVGILLSYIWKEIPFITFMLVAILKNSGQELEEAAQTLGASPWQRFRHVTLPLLAPNLRGACLIVFAFSFGAFELPFLLGKTFPMVLPVWAYRNYSDVDLMARPEGIAIGLIIAAVVICAILLSQGLTRMTSRQGTAR
ncbi:ABC transporter permease [Desulfogranum mediterraneum]|uniref:ABC transporter permease n=1 Tax=Desulfogranum mediterraneum TaxID=160661 RepID=UPI00041E4925|nr:ABC transporter permease subunit [Desulfogranum mediterraneum]